MFTTISEVRRANRRTGHHWFDEGAMTFFSTVIEASGCVFKGRYFVTSDRMEPSDSKRYTLRRANDDGTITTIGDLRQHATVTHARHAIPDL